MKKEKLKVAVIGAGMIAVKAHIPAYLAQKDLVSVEAVVDKTEQSARLTAHQFDLPHWFCDSEKMFEQVKPDLVSICTPNATHAAFVRLALSHGAHVLCEKPLALSYLETRELFELAKEKGLMLMACQTVRFDPEYQAARELVSKGVLGKIHYAEFSAIRRRGIPKWGQFHKKEASGGGCLCDIGVHMIDAAVWMMGSPRFESVSGSTATQFGNQLDQVHQSLEEAGAPAGVTGEMRFDPREFNVEDFAAGTVRFENNIQMNFKTAWAVNLPPHFGLTVAGQKSGLSLPKLTLYSVYEDYQADILPRVFREGPYSQEAFPGHFHLIKNAVRHLLFQEPAVIKPQETLTVAAIIDAFYRSARLQKEVRAEELEA